MITITKSADVAMYLMFDLSRVLKHGKYIVLLLNERRQVVDKAVFESINEIPSNIAGIIAMYRPPGTPSNEDIEIARQFDSITDFVVLGDDEFTSLKERALI